MEGRARWAMLFHRPVCCAAGRGAHLLSPVFVGCEEVPAGSEGPRPVIGMPSEGLGLSRVLVPFLRCSFAGLPLILPVLLGTSLATALVRDGGRSAFHADAQELGLVPSFLGGAAIQFPALWRLSPLPLVLAAGLLLGSTSSGVGWTLDYPPARSTLPPPLTPLGIR